MTKETLLMQYQSESLSALKSMANIHKPFAKTFMDTMKLFMAISDRINFLQLGRYGWFSEQTWEQTSGNFISLQTNPWMDARCWIITEPDSSWNFALEMASSMQESPTVSHPTSESWIFTSMRRLQPSNWPKRHVRGSEYPIPYPPASISYTMLICLNDLFACSGLPQTRKLLTNFSKNLFYLLPEPLRLG